MSTESANSTIVSTPGTCGGKPRIDGHRITVENIAVWHEQQGRSVDEICFDFDLTLGQVYSALSYYFDNRESIDNRMAEGQRRVEALRAESISLVEERLSSHKSA